MRLRTLRECTCGFVPRAVDGVKGKDATRLQNTRYFSNKAGKVVEVLKQIQCHDAAGSIGANRNTAGKCIRAEATRSHTVNHRRRPTVRHCRYKMHGTRMETEHPPINASICQWQRVCRPCAEAHTFDFAWTVLCPRDSLIELVDAHHGKAISPCKVLRGHAIATSDIYKPALQAPISFARKTI